MSQYGVTKRSKMAKIWRILPRKQKKIVKIIATILALPLVNFLHYVRAVDGLMARLPTREAGSLSQILWDVFFEPVRRHLGGDHDVVVESQVQAPWRQFLEGFDLNPNLSVELPCPRKAVFRPNLRVELAILLEFGSENRCQIRSLRQVGEGDVFRT